MQRHWATRQGQEERQAAPTAFTIALSREAGTPGTSVARAVGARLDWPVYDQDLLQRIAEEMGLRTSLLASVDEKGVSWLEECMEAFSSVPAVTESAYVRRLIETVLSLAAHGQCVIVGRGAAHILPPATTLRVRLVGTREDRVAATSRRLKISLAEAARWVETTDKQRSRFVRDHFYKDPADPDQYDLVLNASRFTVEQCAELTVAALRCAQERKEP